MTITEMLSTLKAAGLMKTYRPTWEGEDGRGTILLEVRNPAVVRADQPKGAQIDLYDNSTVRVWTSQKAKANAVASANGFKIRLLDGEAELFIPTNRADEFLHGFGAKVKSNRKPPPLTPEQRALGLQRARAAKNAQAPTH